jgi:glucosamine-6-phosphate deaminase
MKIVVGKTVDEMGSLAAELAAVKLREVVAEKGEARIVLATGESQFTVFKHLVNKDVPWDKVTMFHLDEYVGLPESHGASFRKYLKERFINIVHPKQAVLVDGEGDVKTVIDELTREIRKAPVDLALIGIGENAHIAFNDPPADFNTQESFFVVNLDTACKKQQVGEGWFAGIDDVPNQAITMTVHQIMSAEMIISCVPGMRKAAAIRDTLSAPSVTNMIPATKLREHKDWHLFLDQESASLTDKR